MGWSFKCRWIVASSARWLVKFFCGWVCVDVFRTSSSRKFKKMDSFLGIFSGRLFWRGFVCRCCFNLLWMIRCLFGYSAILVDGLMKWWTKSWRAPVDTVEALMTWPLVAPSQVAHVLLSMNFTWRIIPFDKWLYNYHGKNQSPKDRVVGPLPNGRFMAIENEGY